MGGGWWWVDCGDGEWVEGDGGWRCVVVSACRVVVGGGWWW